MQFNVHEAKTQLSKLLDLVLEGEEVTITRHGVPVVTLVPARQQGLQLGSGRDDTNTKSDKWWQAMTDEEAEAFLAGKK